MRLCHRCLGSFAPQLSQMAHRRRPITDDLRPVRHRTRNCVSRAESAFYCRARGMIMISLITLSDGERRLAATAILADMIPRSYQRALVL